MNDTIAVLGRGTSLKRYRQHDSKFKKIYLANPFTQEITKLGHQHFEGKELIHVVSKGVDCRLHQRQYELFSKMAITGNAMIKRAFPVKYYNFQPMPLPMHVRGFPLVSWDDITKILHDQPDITHDELIKRLETECAEIIAANNARAVSSKRCWPTTGMFAIDLALMSETPTEIYLFGFDCFTNGDDSYFVGKKKSHQTKNAQEVMRYYLKTLVKEFSNTTFYAADELPDMKEPNWNVIKIPA